MPTRGLLATDVLRCAAAGKQDEPRQLAVVGTRLTGQRLGSPTQVLADSVVNAAFVAAAERLEAPVLHTQNPGHGQHCGSVLVHNPFRDP